MMPREAGDGLGELFTAPNLLTLSRLPMAALVWLSPADPVYILSLMALAAAPDVLAARLSFRFRASLLGKAAAVAQFCAIAAILTGSPWRAPLAWATGGLGLAAGTRYVLRAWRSRRRMLESRS